MMSSYQQALREEEGWTDLAERARRLREAAKHARARQEDINMLRANLNDPNRRTEAFVQLQHELEKNPTSDSLMELCLAQARAWLQPDGPLALDLAIKIADIGLGWSQHPRVNELRDIKTEVRLRLLLEKHIANQAWPEVESLWPQLEKLSANADHVFTKFFEPVLNAAIMNKHSDTVQWLCQYAAQRFADEQHPFWTEPRRQIQQHIDAALRTLRRCSLATIETTRTEARKHYPDLLNLIPAATPFQPSLKDMVMSQIHALDTAFSGAKTHWDAYQQSVTAEDYESRITLLDQLTKIGLDWEPKDATELTILRTDLVTALTKQLYALSDQIPRLDQAPNAEALLRIYPESDALYVRMLALDAQGMIRIDKGKIQAFLDRMRKEASDVKTARNELDGLQARFDQANALADRTVRDREIDKIRRECEQLTYPAWKKAIANQLLVRIGTYLLAEEYRRFAEVCTLPDPQVRQKQIDGMRTVCSQIMSAYHAPAWKKTATELLLAEIETYLLTDFHARFAQVCADETTDPRNRYLRVLEMKQQLERAKLAPQRAVAVEQLRAEMEVSLAAIRHQRFALARAEPQRRTRLLEVMDIRKECTKEEALLTAIEADLAEEVETLLNGLIDFYVFHAIASMSPQPMMLTYAKPLASLFQDPATQARHQMIIDTEPRNIQDLRKKYAPATGEDLPTERPR